MRKQRLGWLRWEKTDPYKPDMWTAFTVSIYKPTYDFPIVSVLTSIANGGGRSLFRSKTIEEVQQYVVIPSWGLDRLKLAYTKAEEELERIQNDLRLIYKAKDLQVGSSVVRTDTGEVIAEAERIASGQE